MYYVNTVVCGIDHHIYISYICLISGDDDSILSPEAHYKIGAALAVLGNFIIAVSLNVQVRSFDFLCC